MFSRKIFDEQFHRTMEDRELDTFLRQIKNLEYFVNKKIILKKMDQQQLSEILFYCGKVTNGLRGHFKDYERPKPHSVKIKTRYMLRNEKEVIN